MRLNTARAAALSGVCAIILYIPAFGHQWASDDVIIIQNNATAHEPGAAVSAWFEPYWPSDLTSSGQYRPLTLLSFAADWALFGDDPGMFHVINALWHGLATALFVWVIARWLPPAGAAVGGVIFAIHPVHVEATANVVGRAELMVAVGLFGLILLARRYRAREERRVPTAFLFGGLLMASLFAKEHAVVAVALLALDEWLSDGRIARRSISLYVATIGITVGWLFLFRGIASEYVGVAVAATIRDLTFAERLATMIPVQLDVVRLLAWPFNLASDYNPLVIPRRTGWSVVATLGATTVVAAVSLGFLAARRAPVVAFGIFAAIISYSPTANILFPSGIILSERNLYLAVAAPAAVLAWVYSRWSIDRPWVAGVLGLFGVALVGRSVTRIPFWKDGGTVLIEEFTQHPENYRTHLRLGGFLRRAGDLPAGLAQTLTAGSLFPEDPWVVQYSLVRALDLGSLDIALREARRAYAADSTHPSFARFMVRAHLARREVGPALGIARRSLQDSPHSVLAAESYLQVLDSTDAAPWRKEFAVTHGHYLRKELVAATASARRAVTSVPSVAEDCWDAAHHRDLMTEILGPDVGFACRELER